MTKLEPDAAYYDSLTNKILAEVKKERIERQRKLWGVEERQDLTMWTTILARQVGDLAQKVLDNRLSPSSKGLDDIQKEATQVAAVAVALSESIDDRLGLEAYKDA